MLCQAVILGTALLAALLLWLFHDALLSKTHSEPLRAVPVAITRRGFGAGTYQALSLWAVRHRTYRRLAQTKLSQKGVQHGGNARGRGGPSGSLWASFWRTSFHGRRELPHWREGCFSLRVECRHDHRLADCSRWLTNIGQFPLYSAAASLLNTAGLLLPALLLANFYGAEVNGSVQSRPTRDGRPDDPHWRRGIAGFLGRGFQWFGRALGKCPGCFREIARRMLYPGTPWSLPGLHLLFCSQWFWPQWKQAGLYAAFLVLFLCSQLIVSPISTVAILVQRQDIRCGSTFSGP